MGVGVRSYKAVALAIVGVLACANSASVANDEDKPMQFEWHSDDAPCDQHCRSWISAAGVITETTATQFEAFASKGDAHGSTIVLDSGGGSVLSALALGRAIRRLGMNTTLGKTDLVARADGGAPQTIISPNANCESMCVFVLLGGIRRHVPPESRVSVHQIWLGDKRKTALKETYSAHELSLVQRDLASLARYTVEMGGSIELLELAARAPPWRPLYSLSSEELRSMRITTDDQAFDPKVSTSLLSTDRATFSARAKNNRDN